MSNTSTTIEIRRLSACSFDEAVKIWNEGFQGYFVDLTMSLDRYISRLHREGLSPEFSFLAFCEGRPVGFLLNGIRQSAGRKAAWNGGTGVTPEFRGRGIGKALMRATLDLYNELGVDVAMLEAISANEPAIALYQQFGYEIVDRLVFLQHEGHLGEQSFFRPNSQSYSVESVAPYAVGELEFYQDLAPWQAQWQSLARQKGEALIVSDVNGAPVGYALYKQTCDEQGRTVEVALYQCAAGPGSDTEAVVGCALRTLYAPFEYECKRSTYNFIKSNEVVCMMLDEAGFAPFIEQVHMVRWSGLCTKTNSLSPSK
ncbi:MAG: GNAT family N-acetyltransferase [Pyrinomonadaceae bacterium]